MLDIFFFVLGIVMLICGLLFIAKDFSKIFSDSD